MYAELQCKTNFSFLRGASHAREYIERAAELEIPALAITDINGVYALPSAFEALRDYPSVKLISGCSLSIENHPPLSFLARTRTGYGRMCRMITKAHAGKEKGCCFLSWAELTSFLSESRGADLFAYCTASQETRLGPLKELLGDALFLNLTRVRDGLDERRTEEALLATRYFDIPILATGDVHYHTPSRQKLQDVMTCIREGTTLKKAGLKLFPNEERYLKAPLQIRSLFKDLPQAIDATLEITEGCKFSLSELSYQYPSEWIPEGLSAQTYLERLVWEGALKRYKNSIPIEVEKQILHELTLTKKMNYADYFLTVYDIVDFAKRQNIYCQGRGSAANSVICFCLGITVIDPVKMNLLFERFISEERGEPPDIDVDFEHERREEVIQYIYKKYGRNRAAMISAVRTYRSRSAKLEVGKVFGDALPGEDELANKLMAEIEGFPRHLSIHSCGFTLSALPIIETVPVEPARMEARTICQWDKNDLDTLGLIKIDVLALGFLSAIHKACDLIGIHFSEIPQTDDPRVYGLIQHGDTIGTFQIESRAQISTLGVTQPENFYDLVVEVALVRPGPNVGNMKHPYIERRERAKMGIPYVFEDKETEKILGRTFGVPIFQEQIMKLAIAKAGFTPGEADQLRRAIAAWRSAEAVDALSGRFYEGLLKGGMSDERAQELFGYLKGFSAYGFPESHSASFAILSYLSAWLKFYHPAPLLIGLLNSQPMGFYPVDVLINDAIRHGVKVQPPHPALSHWDATLEAPLSVRMGFRSVHGMDKKYFEHFLAERNRASFKSMEDFLARTRFPVDVIQTMALSDAFSCFGLDQRHSFWKSLELRMLFEKKCSPQLGLFESALDLPASQNTFAAMTLSESILEDYRGLGYSLRGNLMKAVRAENPELPSLKSTDAKRLPHGARATYAGLIMVIQRPPTAKGVAFITLEDEVGSVDVVLFKNVYDTFETIIRSSRLLIVEGRIERRGKSVSLMAEQVKAPPAIALRQRD